MNLLRGKTIAVVAAGCKAVFAVFAPFCFGANFKTHSREGEKEEYGLVELKRKLNPL